jgi:hypothetical protein
MKKYWAIEVENFEDTDSIYYFENYEIAKDNFEILCLKNQNQEEFRRNGEYMASWFDSLYNEYSTHISLIKVELPHIHNKIIF